MTRIEIRPRRRWLAATLVAISLGVAVSAWAFGGGRHGGGGHHAAFREFMIEKMLDRADATDEQRSQISALLGAAHEEMKALREGTRDGLHDSMVSILTAETVDAEALAALRETHQQQMELAMARMSDTLVEAANLLTQEQRIAIVEAMQEHAEGHGGRHGPPF